MSNGRGTRCPDPARRLANRGRAAGGTTIWQLKPDSSPPTISAISWACQRGTQARRPQALAASVGRCPSEDGPCAHAEEDDRHKRMPAGPDFDKVSTLNGLSGALKQPDHLDEPTQLPVEVDSSRASRPHPPGVDEHLAPGRAPARGRPGLASSTLAASIPPLRRAGGRRPVRSATTAVWCLRRRRHSTTELVERTSVGRFPTLGWRWSGSKPCYRAWNICHKPGQAPGSGGRAPRIGKSQAHKSGRVRRTSREESGAQVGKSQAHKRPFHAQNECA